MQTFQWNAYTPFCELLVIKRGVFVGGDLNPQLTGAVVVIIWELGIHYGAFNSRGYCFLRSILLFSVSEWKQGDIKKSCTNWLLPYVAVTRALTCAP